MSRPRAVPTNEYLETLLRYYEEEISGEAYFYGLAEHFAEREKTILLARAERIAAQAVEPLLRPLRLEDVDLGIEMFTNPEVVRYVLGSGRRPGCTGL